jgi:hypothetical protein
MNLAIITDFLSKEKPFRRKNIAKGKNIPYNFTR